MKHTRTLSEEAVRAATQKLTLPLLGLGLAAGTALLFVERELSFIHLVVIAAVGFSAGTLAAQRVLPAHPSQARSAGGGSGGLAGFAYAVPFVIYHFVQFWQFTEAGVPAKLAQMSSQEIASAQAQNFQLGFQFFQSQIIASMAFFILFGWLLGWLIGMLAGVIAKRHANK